MTDPATPPTQTDAPPVLHGIGGHRLAWADLPATTRSAVTDRLGASVVAATNQAGGFSPGVACRLTLSDGRGVFVKALSASRHPHSVHLHRTEAAVTARLPSAVPAPRLLWSSDDGDWVVLVFQAVPGRPPALPWRPAELYRVLGALPDLASVPAPAGLPALADDTSFTGWRDLAGGDERSSRVDGWTRRHLDRLAELEAGWPDAVAGDRLVHGDMRADNVLVTDGGVVFVDWPAAAAGPAWFDLLIMLPSVGMQGGGDPAALFDAHPLARRADPAAVTAALASVTGYFVTHGLLPPPPGLPRVRSFQTAQGVVALDWLRRRLLA